MLFDVVEPVGKAESLESHPGLWPWTSNRI